MNNGVATNFGRSQSLPVEAYSSYMKEKQTEKPGLNGFISQLSGDLSKSKVGKILERHSKSVGIWIGFILSAIFLYCLFSDGDYSVMLTFGSLIHALSFLFVLVKIITTKSCAGVSINMFRCIVALSAARLVSILPFDGYLPFDRSGDGVYRVAEVLSFIFSVAIVYLCSHPKYEDVATRKSDSFNVMLVMGPCLVLAIFVHATLNSFFVSDVAWAFALYMECLCVVPQLVLFQKQKAADSMTSHFLFAQAAARALIVVFWWWTYAELNEGTGIRAYTGHWVMLMQLVQVAMLADFAYMYIKAIVTGVHLDTLLICDV